MKIIKFAYVFALMLVTVGGAFAYDFWGVTLGTEDYQGNTCFTFDGVADSGLQYVVGGYKYTRVDSQWLGAFDAPTPGEGFLASRRSDAVGLFYKPAADSVEFVVIATSAQYGQSAPECGTGTRLFGPGDLKIDINGHTYGIGLRTDDLRWAVDPYATAAHLQIYNTDGTAADIHSRDMGTLGDVEADPIWARAGNQDCPANDDRASAFFISGSGEMIGSASVDFEDTGLYFNGVRAFAYTVSVPWATLGIDPGDAVFTASWRPDCGNDLISGDFASFSSAPVPEPGSIVTIIGGLAGIAACRKRG